MTTSIMFSCKEMAQKKLYGERRGNNMKKVFLDTFQVS